MSWIASGRPPDRSDATSPAVDSEGGRSQAGGGPEGEPAGQVLLSKGGLDLEFERVVALLGGQAADHSRPSNLTFTQGILACVGVVGYSSIVATTSMPACRRVRCTLRRAPRTVRAAGSGALVTARSKA